MISADRNPSPNSEAGERKRLIVNPHQKRSVRNWIIPLILIVAVIVFLPRLVDRF